MWTVVYLVLTVLCLFPGPESVIIASGQEQMMKKGDDGHCPLSERARKQITISIGDIFAKLKTITCNGTPGWRRVAFIDMTNASYNCPTGLNLMQSCSKRTCGRSHTTPRGCSSTTFSVGGLPYSRVCGRIRAYQFGVADAFWYRTFILHFFLEDVDQGIEGYYVDGVSLTHGAAGRRQHIWTFATGRTEVSNTRYRSRICPCDISHNYVPVPAFVGNDYFCESGIHSEWDDSYNGVLFPDDVLWDGQNCTFTSTCCQFNNPPWFAKNLTNATTDDIELRICTNSIPAEADVPIELIELYVQ